LHKQKHLLKEHEIKIARYGLKYLNKLIIIKEKEKKEHEEKTKRETQLFVSTSEALAPANIP
jgi:hypothetical protein